MFDADKYIDSLINPRPVRPARTPSQGFQLTPAAEQSLIASVGAKAAGGLGKFGSFMDLPASMVRDTIGLFTGKPDSNPFDQLLTPFSQENRTSGNDLLEHFGMASRQESWPKSIAGFGLEVATDPLSYLTLGGAAVSRAGSVARKAGMMRDATRVAAKKAGAVPGSIRNATARTTGTAGDLFSNASRAQKRAFVREARRKGLNPRELMGETLGGVAGFGIPFRDPSILIKSPRAAAAMDAVGGALFDNPAMRFAKQNLSAPVREAFTKPFQAAARAITSDNKRSMAANRRFYYDTSRRVAEAFPNPDNDIAIRQVAEDILDAPNEQAGEVVGSIRQKLDDLIRGQQEAGHPIKDMQGEYVGRYMPRRTPGPQRAKGRAGSVQSHDPSQLPREDFLSNLEGGTGTIKQLFSHPELLKLKIDKAPAKKIRDKFNELYPDLVHEPRHDLATGLLPTNPDFKTHLSRFAPTLHHHTDAATAAQLLGGKSPGANVRLTSAADTPIDGVSIEFDSAFRGRVDQKPGWEDAYKQGNADFIADMPDGDELSRSIKSVTVDWGAIEDPEIEQLLGRLWRLTRLDDSQKWTQEQLENGFRWSRNKKAKPNLPNPKPAKERLDRLADYYRNEISVEAAQQGLFGNHTMVDVLSRLDSGEHAKNAAVSVMTVLAPVLARGKEGIEETFGKVDPENASTLRSAMQTAGLDVGSAENPGRALQTLMEETGRDADELLDTLVPDSMFRDMDRTMNPFKAPDPVTTGMRHFDSGTNLWKGSQTGIWPGFSSRNFTSGQTRNAFDSAFGWRELREADALVRGPDAYQWRVSRGPERKRVNKLMRETFGKEEADAMIRTWDARADMWSRETGRNLDDFFKDTVLERGTASQSGAEGDTLFQGDGLFGRMETPAELAAKAPPETFQGKAMGSVQRLLKDPEFRARWEADAGVSEGYTIGQHTEHVLARFGKIIDSDPDLANTIRDPDSLMEAIALHDIGKPDAIRAGDKSRQHEFTVPLLRKQMEESGHSKQSIDMAEALIGHDVFGDLLQGRITVDKAAEQVQELARKAGMRVPEFSRLAKAFYKADASSYPYLESLLFRNGELREVRKLQGLGDKLGVALVEPGNVPRNWYSRQSGATRGFSPANVPGASFTRLARDMQGEYADQVAAKAFSDLEAATRSSDKSANYSFNAWQRAAGDESSVIPKARDFRKAAGLQDIIRQAPKTDRDLVVVRQFQESVDNVKPGDVIQSRTITATSLDPEYGDILKGGDSSPSAIIEVPEGTQGFAFNSIEGVSIPQEHEFVFGIGQQFEVLGKEGNTVRLRARPMDLDPVKTFEDAKVGDTIGGKRVVDVRDIPPSSRSAENLAANNALRTELQDLHPRGNVVFEPATRNSPGRAIVVKDIAGPGENVLFQRASETPGDPSLEGFYSKLARVTDEKVGGKISWPQYKATLTKAGVKQEEIEDMGLESFFADGKPKTKAEIQQYLDENRIEVVITENPNKSFRSHTVPGGEGGSYREVEFRLPSQPEATAELRRLEDSLHDKYGGDYTKATITPEEQARLDDLRAKELRRPGDRDLYQGGHYDPEVLFHARMDDITLPNGKKELRVQEIQSDWLQAGRRHGFRGEIPKGWTADKQFGAFHIRDADGNTVAMVEAASAEDALRNFRGERVPDAPFKKSWHMLAMKEILRRAAAEGYESVSIVRGSDIARAVDGPAGKLEKFYNKVANDAKKYTKRWGSFLGETNVPQSKVNADLIWSRVFPGNRANDPPYTRLINSEGDVVATLEMLPNGRARTKGAGDVMEFGSVQEAKQRLVDLHGGPTFTGDAKVFEITDKMRRDLLGEGQPLYQGAKGQVRFTADNKRIITAFESADFSTLAHETAHIFRRDLSEELLQRAAAALGVSDPHNWSREAEEAFATGFEGYLRTGRAPRPELQGVFEKFRVWLTRIYRAIKGSPSEANVSPELKSVFDEMLGGNLPRKQGRAADLDFTDIAPIRDRLRGKYPGRDPSTLKAESAEEMRQLAAELQLAGPHVGIRQDVTGELNQQPVTSIDEIMGELPGGPGGSQRASLRSALRKWTFRDPETSFNPLEQRGVGGRTTARFGPAAAGDEMSYIVEGNNRIAPLIKKLRKGVDPVEAGQQVKDAQVDYSGANFTRFEREVLARLFPFYKFSKGNVGFVGNQLSTRPGGPISQAIRLINAGRGGDALTPDYVSESASIPLDGGLSSAVLGDPPEGSQRYLTGLGLMLEDPFTFGGSGVRGALLEGMSRMNPFPKAAAEWATGQSFFQRGPMGGRAIEDLDPTVGRTIRNVQQMVSGDSSYQQAVRYPGSGPVEFILGNSPASRLLTTTRQMTDPRKSWTAKFLNTLTGMRITDVTPASSEAILREKARNMMYHMGAKTFERTYLPEDVMAQMSPQAQMAAREYQALFNELARRSKARANAK